jgi:hypothetical protein
VRTDDLVRTLVADQAAPAASIERRLAAASAVSFAVSAVAFWLTLGLRDDFVEALATVRFDLKFVETLLLAATAAFLVLRLARPGAHARGAALAMLAAPVLLAAAVAGELIAVPPAQWSSKLVGSNSLVCLTAIPLLALPPLAGALYALRQGAPTRPALAGAVAGLLAGGFAATLYAAQCTDDSPLFVATWYGIAIAAVAVIGALAGRKLLRW